MVIGTDLTVDTSNTAKKLFTLTSTGEGKLRNAVYTKFKGKIFRNIDRVDERDRYTFAVSLRR